MNFYYKLNVPTQDIRNTNIYCIRTETEGIPMDIKFKKKMKNLYLILPFGGSTCCHRSCESFA